MGSMYLVFDTYLLTNCSRKFHFPLVNFPEALTLIELIKNDPHAIFLQISP